MRGAWGELQLQRVVELAGMVEHCDFVLQRTDTADDRVIRPDLRVDLAEGKFVYVDAKVPLSAFLDAQETDDPRTREEAMTRFAQNVRTHVDQLGGKRYWQSGAGTPEFVVLFMPSEALAAEAFAILPDLHEYAARRDVVLATPTTLIALLRAVAYGWKQAKLAENAAEVLQLGPRAARSAGHPRQPVRQARVGRCATSVIAYNETIATMEGRVLVKARQLTDLKVSGAELKTVTSVDDPVRQIQAPELVEDAVQVEPMVGRRQSATRAAPGRGAARGRRAAPGRSRSCSSWWPRRHRVGGRRVGRAPERRRELRPCHGVGAAVRRAERDGADRAPATTASHADQPDRQGRSARVGQCRRARIGGQLGDLSPQPTSR